MTRSRLRRPTSKSTTTTRFPSCARAAPRAAVVVVLPTPPLPDVTTTTLAIWLFPSMSVERRDLHRTVLQPRMHRSLLHMRLKLVGDLVVAVDGNQLCLQPVAEDARLVVAEDPGERSAAQGPVDVDRARRDDFGPRRHRADDRHVAVLVDDCLPRPD